jgi:hypothetical protein
VLLLVAGAGLGVLLNRSSQNGHAASGPDPLASPVLTLRPATTIQSPKSAR